MTVEVKQPIALQKFVNEDMTLTLDGLELLQRIVEALQDHETRIDTLEP